MSGHPKVGDETIMVWGWDTRARCLIRIEPGQADDLREACRAGQIVCPHELCSEPALTTRRSFENSRGTTVVDGFRHQVAPTPSHSPESVQHITAKLLVANRLRRDGWDVSVERNDARVARRPDVHATKDGRELAVEVQYSNLSQRSWTERSADLASTGAEVSWLWGLQATRARLDLSAIQQMTLAQGRRLWWIHAATNQLGVPVVRDGTLERSPTHRDRTIRLEWVDINDATVTTDGFTHLWCDILDSGRETHREALLRDLHAGIRHLLARRTARNIVTIPTAPIQQRRRSGRSEPPAGQPTVKIELPPIDWQRASARERRAWYAESRRLAIEAMNR